MKTYERLLLQNRAWVEEHLDTDPDFFKTISSSHQPEVLWIGCSDSRVPVNDITNTHAGEVFVHRNIANMVVHTDLNMLSVLQYAVNVLEIKHIIVCGHHGCGGIKAALTHQELGLMNKWLRNIKDIYRLHQDELAVIKDPEEQTNLLVELNVREQVMNLAKTSIVQHAWHDFERPTIHGWVYAMNTGLIKDICMMEPGTPLDDIYTFDLD